MGYSLVIAEKPSVAQAYAKVLGCNDRKDGYIVGNGYIVSWCIGHLVEMCMPDEYCKEWEGNWKVSNLPMIPEEWKHKVSKNTSKQYRILKSLMDRDDVTEIIEACDAGREGELISRLVYYQAHCNKPLKRLWISSMEDSAIRDGFNNLKEAKEYDALYQSALCRSKADWLIGMNGTRLFSCKYGKKLNVGRVVSPTLAMIVDREYHIEHFVKKPFYRVHLDLNGINAVSEKIDDKEKAEDLKARCQGSGAKVASVIKSEKSKAAPKLYDLTSLQRDANKYFGLTAKQTLDIAQGLYEKKLITYPRTDSRFLTDDMDQKARCVVAKIQEVFNFTDKSKGQANEIIKVLDSRKVSDHHALMPTEAITKEKIAELSEKERKIISLIANEFLLAVMPVAIYENIEAQIACENEVFTVKGTFEEVPGYKAQEKAFLRHFGIKKGEEDGQSDIYDNPFITDAEKNGMANALEGSPDDETYLKTGRVTELREGMEFNDLHAAVSESFTKPPAHYTESSLLSAMERAGASEMEAEVERKGLGTPATRADIIEKLVKNGFVKRDKKQMLPTEDGKKLISILPDKLKSPSLTAEWENKLVLVSKNELEAKKFMEEIEKYVEEVVSSEKETMDDKKEDFGGGPNVIGKCPNCGENIISGKFGAFCSNKCGMSVSKAYGIDLTDEQVEDVLNGKKILVKGIRSKKGSKFDAYLTPNGIKEYSYTNKNGETISGLQFDYEMTFPEKKKK